MLYKGATPIQLSLSQINFLHHFLSNRPSSLFNPKTLLNLLNTQKIEAKKTPYIVYKNSNRFLYTATFKQP